MSLFSSILDDLRHSFRSGHMVKKLVLINVVVFVLVQVVHIVCNIAFGPEGGELKLWDVLNYFCIPGSASKLLWQPWSVFTNMFLHEGLWHVLGNMIWLWLFGTIVGDLIGDQRVLPVYLMSGLAGNLLYFLSANLMPGNVGGYALGASAAVMGFGGTALMLNPDYRVSLFFWGEVKLKYIVLIMVLLDLVGAAGIYNAGGHAAHIGGFIFGILYVYALREGSDWTTPVNRLLNRIVGLFDTSKRRPTAKKVKMDTTHRAAPRSAPAAPPQRPTSEQERLDTILDKIKQQGFDQLSQDEKDFLYEASRK